MFLVPEQGILLGFSTPEQGSKFKTPVAHTRLIKVEPPPPGSGGLLENFKAKNGAFSRRFYW